MKKIGIPLLLVLLSVGCGNSTDPAAKTGIQDALTFYISFENGLSADFAIGDPYLYTAPSWPRRAEAEPYRGDTGHLQIREGAGVSGNVLWIDTEYEPVFFYRGADNIHYKPENWSGTVSFRLRLDPDEDLREGYSDPILLTSRGWNDRALFVDFTDEVPRHFRFAVFPDREVWDPDERSWDEVPEEERPMLDVPGMPFSRDAWTHVAFTFSNFNLDGETGRVLCYIDGEFTGELEIENPIFTWEPDEVAIWIGYHYRGYFDELALFNRALSEAEIVRIYEEGITPPPGSVE